ncbi:MAG: hypothetical protein JNK15_19690 [Planctomycetes bacterium]|nr:hypothetical protein [Planctomycetota bacterium]
MPIATTLRPACRLAFLLALTSTIGAQTAQQAAVQVNATVTANPPSITFTWPLDATATNYFVRRRLPGSLSWGASTTIPGGGAATSWSDGSVLLGARYEYWFQKAGTPQGNGFVTAGVEAIAQHDRGKVVLLVDATQVAGLGARLDRLVSDLTGDGYHVLRHDVAPGAAVPSVKALVTADYAAFPGQVKTVFVLGRVPVPYSGWIAPDGHTPDHSGAWPADCYYADVNGIWTDTSVNVTAASRPETDNVPGDGKWDQSTLPSDVELGIGRVDFANMPAFAAGETALLAAYLDKDHDWRHQNFTCAAQAVIDDNFGWFSGEAFAASGWRACSALVGTGNITAADYFSTLNVPSGPGHVWSYGCGGGSYTSAGGIGTTTDFTLSSNRSVFTMLFGSYFGDWDTTNNFLRAPLAQGLTLTNVWAGRPHWQFHPMGLGESIGTCAKLSMNDGTAAGYGSRFVHVALMGAPTLRQHVVAPPSGVTVTDAWPAASLAWAPSPDTVAGYHVYRAATPAGPFTRLTPNAVAATTFVDPTALAGASTYLVRALRLETTPTGSYWNLSQGAFATATLPAQAAAHTQYGAGCHGLSLAASPTPVSTASSGTLVTYTIGNVPEASTGSGVYVGLTIVSLQQDAAGTSLAGLGMPGCTSWVGSFDVTTAFVGAAPTQTTTFQVPAGLPGGVEFFAMAAALVVPGTLNAFGAATSDGVRSFVNGF